MYPLIWGIFLPLQKRCNFGYYNRVVALERDQRPQESTFGRRLVHRMLSPSSPLHGTWVVANVLALAPRVVQARRSKYLRPCLDFTHIHLKARDFLLNAGRRLVAYAAVNTALVVPTLDPVDGVRPCLVSSFASEFPHAFDFQDLE